MPILLKKIALSFLSALIVFFSFAPYLTVQAAVSNPQGPTPAPTGTWYNQDFKEWFGKVYDSSNPSEIFGERYTAAQVQWVIYGLWAFIFNIIIPQKITACVLTNSVDINACGSEIQSLLSDSSSPIQNLAKINKPVNQNLWSLVFATDRPLSGIAYVKNKIQNFSLVPVAHAQTAGAGFGFDALQPVQSMWQAFRDISYGLFVIVAVVFAFMIMFRVKISPQVVISVQSAIPKLVITLLLVTFSYAIAGFLIDLMYVVIGIFSLAASRIFSFAVGPISLGATQYFNFLTLGQPFGWNSQIGVIGILGLYIFCFFIALMILIILNIGVIGTALAGGIAAGLVLSGIGNILIIIGLVVLLITIIIMVFQVIRVLWALLKAFVNVLLLTIFAPIQLTLGAVIPNFGFGAWVKSYLAALSTFVVTGVLILFSYIFLVEGVSIGLSGFFNGNVGQFIVKLLFGGGNGGLLGAASGNLGRWPPLLGTGSGTMSGLLLVGVSFVIFTLIPKSAEIVQGFITGKPFAYGSAVGEAFGPVSGITGFATGAVTGGVSRAISEEITSRIRNGTATRGSEETPPVPASRASEIHRR